jgi:hypothetical protein
MVVMEFIVQPHFSGGKYNVFVAEFEQPIAQFEGLEAAERYALRLAGTKRRWKVDVYDGHGELAATYNSEDDSMPRC